MRGRVTAAIKAVCALAFSAILLAAVLGFSATAQQVKPEITTQTFAQLSAAPQRLELTPQLLSNYIANRQTARLNSAALEQANALAAGNLALVPPQPATRRLTPQLLQNYVEDGFVPTATRLGTMRDERTCLAQAVYHEARGEPESGQWAVAEVILNRVNSARYPDSICGVVYQNANLRNRCQFSFACDGQPDGGGDGNRIVRESWVKANLIAEAAYQRFEVGDYLTELPSSALFYHNRTVAPRWASQMQSVASIGGHVFYAAL